MKQTRIGLLDCNNFFVSCERLFRPDLVGKPVVVLSSNDGCVVARSQEVKDIGVLMGVPYFQIKDIVKKHGITTFSSHFALYRDISRRVFSVMQEEVGKVEQYSIDEAFFQVVSDPEETVERLKKRVEQVVGIPVSVGVAATKTQAKYANQIAKKNRGVKVLSVTEWQTLSPQIPLQDIWGVGGKMELQFKAQGLRSVADLLASDRSRIDQLFGLVGLRLQQELAGISVHKIHREAAEIQQSIMSSRSFKKEVTSFETLADSVAYHVRHAAAELRTIGQKARVLRVSILPSRHGAYLLRGGKKEAILPVPTDDTVTLVRVATQLLEELYEPGVPYKKTGVTLADFVGAATTQDTLWGDTPKSDDKQLSRMLDVINKGAGREVVLVGSRLRDQEWQSKSQSRSPAYTTRWSDVATVQAK